MKVSVYEAKSKLSQMINKALEGEEVIITRNGEDTVKTRAGPKEEAQTGSACTKGRSRSTTILTIRFPEEF